MRLTFHHVLPASPERVWELLVDPAHLARWQPTLQSAELLHGTVGQVGAVTRLTYRESGRTVVLTETVLAAEAPTMLRCRYASAAMDATISNTLSRLRPDVTGWSVVQELRLNGWLRPAGLLLRPFIGQKFRADMARLHTLAAEGSVAGGAA